MSYLNHAPPAASLAAACRQHANLRSEHRAACFQFDSLLRRFATVADVTPDNLARFRSFLIARGRTTEMVSAYLTGVRALARLIEPGLDARHKLARLPEPPDGSLRAFFEKVYRPERLTGGSERTRLDYRFVLLRLYGWRGRDVMLSELTDQLASDHFNWLLALGCRATTVNKHRGYLFALWRLAVERNLIEREPRVRKLRESRDEPDAWTLDQVRRLLEAPLAVRWNTPTIAGIPTGHYFRALLLVIYWTGLRRGTVLKLRCRWIDLATGWLDVGGEAMKNGRGKRMRLGADALNAIRAIWQPERELLFPFPFTLTHFYKLLRRVFAVAGLPNSSRACGTRLHKLRRTVATITTAKMGLAAAADLLGHSETEVTRRYVDTSKLPGHDATEFLPLLSGGGEEATSARALSDARTLFTAGYVTATAMLIRVALERWLDDRCRRHDCRSTVGLRNRAGALRERGVLSTNHCRAIGAMAKAANKAAHGQRVSRERVEGMLKQLENLLGGLDDGNCCPTAA